MTNQTNYRDCIRQLEQPTKTLRDEFAMAALTAAWDVQREEFIRMIGCIESGVMYEIGGDK